MELILNIEPSKATELADILAVHLAAFADEGPAILKLVDELLKDETAKPLISLVAKAQDLVSGHLLLTKAQLKGSSTDVSAAILAPLAVLPSYQNQGVGSRLIAEGLNQLKQQGIELVFVLGYPDYYNRSGFVTAKPYGLKPPYSIPQEYTDAWMVQELEEGALERSQGLVVCADSLMSPEHWGP